MEHWYLLLLQLLSVMQRMICVMMFIVSNNNGI